MTDNDKFWIGTSWKMNKTLAESLYFADALLNIDEIINKRIQAFVIPPFTSVRQVKATLASTSMKVGAQNMHWSDSGPWTGEVSTLMIKDCQLDMVELGHSERREYFGESNHTVGLKVAAALKHGLTPLICIGESLEDRENGNAQAVLETQVTSALQFIPQNTKQATILFAYEPIWAIGEHGLPATPEYADARQAEIINVATAILGHRVPCLYGGSVNPQNCEALINCPNIDGLFIGRSAWEVEGYLDILTKCGNQLS
jgi:L-erythrulose 1-phosphate isomerase